MSETEHYRKQVCSLYGQRWEQYGTLGPPKGDSCEICVIKWKCRGASGKKSREGIKKGGKVCSS